MAPPGVPSVKLMQLNAWMGRLTPQIVSLIESEKPDILTTQEMFTVDGPVVFPDNMFNCFELIKSAGNFEHSFFSPLWNIQASHHNATFGNAIFSKYPLSNPETFFTHGKYNPDLTPETRIPNTRNAQIVTLEIDGKPLFVVNHHGHWEITPEGSETTVEKMEIVKARLVKQSGPLIFAGDLNLNPNTPALRIFDGLLEDLTATHNIKSTLSVLGKVPNVACDHVFVNDLIKVQTYKVSDELVSDHRALVLEFDI
jgi:endonuclease/exonuclease/phosphatase family metal-dependent hydrolase